MSTCTKCGLLVLGLNKAYGINPNVVCKGHYDEPKSNSTTNKDLEEILVQMLDTHEFELTPVHTPKSEYDSVQQAIKALNNYYADKMLQIIGEDEPEILIEQLDDGSQIVGVNPKNELREELRQAIKTWRET